MARITARTFTLKTGETCLVRSAEETDAAEVLRNAREMLTSPFNVSMADELDLTEDQERAWIADHATKPGWLALAPVVDGRIVGLLNFENGSRRRLAHRGSLGMSVLEAWRGRGVGDALLTALLDWARESPVIEKVCLAVLADNEAALTLYRKHGFVVEGRRVREVKMGPGDYRDDFVMFRLVKD